MTHKTGPRMEKVEKIASHIMVKIQSSGLTISEAKEALHEVDMWLTRIMLRPWENETCPTCPKDMQERGDEIELALAALKAHKGE